MQRAERRGRAATIQKPSAFKPWQRHAARADLCRKNEIGESALRRSGQYEEDHEGAVHGDQREVFLRQHGAVQRPMDAGPGELRAHGEREQSAGGDSDEREQEIVDADGAVVRGEDAS